MAETWLIEFTQNHIFQTRVCISELIEFLFQTANPFMNIKNSVLSDKDDESAVKKFLNGRSVVY